MKQEKFIEIIKQHQHWLRNDCEGWKDMKANVSYADLTGVEVNNVSLYNADMHKVKLHKAKLNRVNLSYAGLYGADLSDADLSGSNLSNTDLSYANLSNADLRRVDLSNANLCGADLRGAILQDTILYMANLYDAKLSDDDQIRLGKVLDEPLTGYKKTKEGVIITATIPVGAIVYCINGSKCRTNKAIITDMDSHYVLHSMYDNRFEYRLGQEIIINDFCLMYNVECASGFHFFRTRKEAEEY